MCARGSPTDDAANPRARVSDVENCDGSGELSLSGARGSARSRTSRAVIPYIASTPLRAPDPARMRLSAVEKALTAFSTSDEPTTLALKGPWGRGKTFYWDRFIRARAAESPTQGYAYVSLFGLGSLNEMKRAVAINARPLNSLDKDDAKTYLEDALQSKWWMPRMTPAAGVFKVMQGGAHAGSPIAEDLLQRELNGLVICVDDLERRGDGLRLSDVLGYCSHLKERRGCRVVVILNEEAFSPEEANEFRGLKPNKFKFNNMQMC